jgi:acetyltransferase-like isoleucine patch superfamily enzyme
LDETSVYPEFDWWRGWEDLEQIQSPAAIFARPAGLASLGRGSYFTEPYTIASPHRVHVGHGVKVSERLAISVYESADGAAGGSLRIGDGCLIGADLHAHCTHDVELGDYVGISARVAIGDCVSDLHPERAGGNEPTDLSIRIRDGAIVGIGAIILPGVTIGERAAIGGGAVVTRDVPPRSLVFGNPARVVGSWDEATGKWVTGLQR